MPPTSARKDLDVYRIKLGRAQIPVICRQCGASILPKVFEKHVSEVHGFNVKLGCAWCQEKFWNRSEKRFNAFHLRTCFENFLRPPRPTTPPPLPLPETPQLLMLRHLYLEKHRFGIIALVIHTLFEFIWPLSVEVIPLFQDDNLNLATAYLRHYFELQDTHDFYHVYVKAVVLERFVKAMEKDKGNTRTLLFSCWCDGGPYEDPMYRQHRHMIVVSPKGHFEKNIWKKVKMSPIERPCPSYPCKGMTRIKSPMHLVNVFGYVSHRKSRCAFESNRASTPAKLHHFYLYKTLPIDFRLPLALLWDGGLKQLLYDRTFRNVSLSRLIQNPIVSVKGQWKQKMKHFYGHQRGLVVPVVKELMPTRELPWDAVCTFYLLEGEKLYFEYSRENESMDQEAWLRRQALAGNCFYDAVEEEVWTPRPPVQTALSVIMPQAERIKELESENASLKERHEAMRRETRATFKDAKGRHVEEMRRMKRRYEEDNSSLKMENARLKKKLAAMKREHKEKWATLKKKP